MSIFHLLTAVFVLLKLLGQFPYSWWVVASPMLVLLALVILIDAFKGVK